ncbi:MAG: hypothetical protein KC910_30090, partial [Candidatus Eremiobacteraeota bacterium]|nr:hypothetical protein [Candidatus Eremiobacteraeota bacterium]
KRVSKETAVTEMARRCLASADSRSKVRHQVIVHGNCQTGQGFYDTDRGLLPADPAAVDEALKQPGMVVAGGQAELPAGSGRAPLSEARPGRPSRWICCARSLRVRWGAVSDARAEAAI